MQVVTEDPVPPTQLNAKVPPDLETICLKCLQKEPVKRYDTAEALADDLKHFKAGEPILARPVGSVERTVKWVKRRPGVAGLIAAVVVVAFVGFTGISGGLGWALVERGHAIGQEKTANDEREKAEKLAADNGLLAEQQKKLAEHNKLLAEKATKARRRRMIAASKRTGWRRPTNCLLRRKRKPMTPKSAASTRRRSRAGAI